MNETLDFVARYVWPLVVMWNVYLFRTLTNLRLKIAEEYTSKQDLQKMFTDFESRLAERFTLFEKIIKK